MRAGTYPARGYATLELSGLELSFTGACAGALLEDYSTNSTPTINLPALDRFQPLYFPFSGLQRPVFLLNSRLINVGCSRQNDGRAYCIAYARFFAEFLELSLPVCLGLLDQFTCVGLRYGQTAHS